MAIEVRINPIDFEPNTAIGIDLPMNASSGNSFKLNYLSIDQAVANAKNLLLTNRGERVMQPEFGCDLRKTLFQNITEELIIDIENRIRTSFEYRLSKNGPLFNSSTRVLSVTFRSNFNKPTKYPYNL